MPSSNDAIKSLMGTNSGNATGSNANPNTNVALKNISVNGALMNQNISLLTQTISTLIKTWGG